MKKYFLVLTLMSIVFSNNAFAEPCSNEQIKVGRQIEALGNISYNSITDVLCGAIKAHELIIKFANLCLNNHRNTLNASEVNDLNEMISGNNNGIKQSKRSIIDLGNNPNRCSGGQYK